MFHPLQALIMVKMRGADETSGALFSYGDPEERIPPNREVAPLLSDDHFSVDGTLVKAWASIKSFQPKADAFPPDDEGPGGPLASDTNPEPAISEIPV